MNKIMIFTVPGWELGNGKFELLVQLMGLLLLTFIIVYIVLSSRGSSES